MFVNVLHVERVDIIFVDSSILWLSIKIFEIVFISFDIIFVDSIIEDMPFPVPVALAIFAGRIHSMVLPILTITVILGFDRFLTNVFDLDDLMLFGFQPMVLTV